MTRPQHGMAESIGVERRTAEPPREEQEELFPCVLERRSVDAPEPREFGLKLHQVVETLDERAHALLASDELVGGLRKPFLDLHGHPQTKAPATAGASRKQEFYFELQVRDAGVASTLPAASIARTWNVCWPFGSDV